ncbi:short-chain fatty acid transporter [Muriicola sp. Z0-33]|uniref:short-chain fatty acid transporter n=1 Tax=Muriicola sp. Z0-33 TaxID=2816957 RepID=UPI002238949D|nr:TIGR00366 family protein [Muriicola sp. Z0-33]MCW5516706.1 short-chain fatty acid transporter [Muriicola sp. Z0-33]
MIKILGEKFTLLFLKYMPNAFVFAILLTLITALGALFWIGAEPLEVVSSWYKGFFDLLAFAMQIVLIIITGFSIALSPVIKKGIDKLARHIKTPAQVYFFVVLMGSLLCLISFGWVVIACVLARELAKRVEGVNYPYLVACVYFSMGSWVLGLSSSIPLLLNSENNFLISTGVLNDVIATSYTLQSGLNIAMMAIIVIGSPLLLLFIKPKSAENKELKDLMSSDFVSESKSIKEEASDLKLPFNAVSDKLNNNSLIQMVIVLMGLVYIVYHFASRGLDLNFNIMIFIFLIVGLLLHQTPSRYVIAMKRASSNVSGILFQYPFYAGIMGIMLYTGLGAQLGQILAAVATIDNYPFFAYLTGGVINFAIPSAGGEFAVVGPSIIDAVKELGAGLPQEQLTKMISRASMSVAYGESLSNLLQPFYLLIVLPIMGQGIKIQARDIMGYFVIPFVLFFIIQSAMVVWMPL